MEPRASNSYDFVRFSAASAVLFSHHFALLKIPEPPVPGYGEDFGKLAVEVFFCLSGFLIPGSNGATKKAQVLRSRSNFVGDWRPSGDTQPVGRDRRNCPD